MLNVLSLQELTTDKGDELVVAMGGSSNSNICSSYSLSACA